jgi:hypothetical protein
MKASIKLTEIVFKMKMTFNYRAGKSEVNFRPGEQLLGIDCADQLEP